MRDALLRAALVGDVFQGRDPAAVGQRVVKQLDDPAAGGVDHGLRPSRALAEIVHEIDCSMLDISRERAGVLAVLDQLAQRATGLDHVARGIEHLDIAFVAKHQPLIRVEQQPARAIMLLTAVSSRCFCTHQPLAACLVLAPQLANDQEQRDRDHQRRERRDDHQQPRLLAPFLQRRIDGRRDDDGQRERPDLRWRCKARGAVDRARRPDRADRRIAEPLKLRGAK